jgi:hypothetical protein
MRATVLLSISASLALGCGKSETVPLTARLKMSSVPGDWCGFTNPDTIRLDCPFELGFYVLDASQDAGASVLKTRCVKMDKDPMRTWANLYQDLNSAMVALDNIQQGVVRVEMVGIEPPQNKMCDYESSVASASLYGKSDAIPLMGTDVPNRYDIATKCVKPFTPTATCIP